jgi:hypothetical protein
MDKTPLDNLRLHFHALPAPGGPESATAIACNPSLASRAGARAGIIRRFTRHDAPTPGSEAHHVVPMPRERAIMLM